MATIVLVVDRKASAKTLPILAKFFLGNVSFGVVMRVVAILIAIPLDILGVSLISRPKRIEKMTRRHKVWAN